MRETNHDAKVRLLAEVLDVKTLTINTRDLFDLFERYYEAVSYSRFISDLEEKNVIIVLRVRDGGIVGFTTASFHVQDVAGEAIHYIFSGDTVVEPTYWGDQTLLKAFFRMAGRRKALNPTERLYWFTIFNGHRTFRILPNFFHGFMPSNKGGRLCEDLDKVRCAIASKRYGANFDPTTGLIDFGRSLGHLKSDWAQLEDAGKRSTFAAFFLSRNPEAKRGVELAGIGELDLANLKRYAKKSFAIGLHEAGSAPDSNCDR
jgi:hypothetical protein